MTKARVSQNARATRRLPRPRGADGGRSASSCCHAGASALGKPSASTLLLLLLLCGTERDAAQRRRPGCPKRGTAAQRYWQVRQGTDGCSSRPHASTSPTASSPPLALCSTLCLTSAACRRRPSPDDDGYDLPGGMRQWARDFGDSYTWFGPEGIAARYHSSSLRS